MFNDKINRETVDMARNMRWKKYAWTKFSTTIKPAKQFQYAYPVDYENELNNFFDKVHPY